MYQSVRRYRIALTLFLLSFFVYISHLGYVTLAPDSVWALPVTFSLIHEGNIELSEFRWLPQLNNYGLVRAEGGLYNFFPVGTSLLVAPLIALVQWTANLFWSVDLYAALKQDRSHLFFLMEYVSASAVAACIPAVVYATARRFLTAPWAALLAVVVAFSTSVWSTASIALWQHGPSMLLLALALYLLVRGDQSPHMVQYASIPLALAYLTRPTNSIPLLLFSAYIFLRYRRYFVPYLLWGAAIGLPFVYHSLTLYGTILPPYYLPDRVGHGSRFLEALAGNLISPARGLLVYSPVFLFSLWGLAFSRRRWVSGDLQLLLLLVVTLHWLAISSFPHWWAGHSYGPRLFSDMIPFLAFLLIPFLADLQLVSEPWSQPRVWLFGIATLFGVFVHFRGATQPPTAAWNVENPVAGTLNVDDDPARNWDWSDPQFWRGLRPAQMGIAVFDDPELAFPMAVLGTQGGRPTLRVSVLNYGDRPLRVRIESSRRLVPQGALDPAGVVVSGLGRTEIPFVVDAQNLAAGPHALGTLSFAPVSGRGNPQGQPQVLPVSALLTDQPHSLLSPVTVGETGITAYPGPMYLWSQGSAPAAATRAETGEAASPLPSARAGDGWKAMQFLAVIAQPLMGHRHSAWKNQLWFPPDFHLQAQPGEEVPAAAGFFGQAWYDREGGGDFAWRWAGSPASLSIYSRQRQRIVLECDVAAVQRAKGSDAPGVDVAIRHNYREVGTQELAAETSLTLTMDAQAGWNIVSLESTAGNVRPVDRDPSSGDTRDLSFAVSRCRLAGSG